MPAIATLAITTGTELYQVYAQNKAQNKATDAQTAANQQATQQQQQASQQARQDIAATSAQQGQLYSPYLNLGSSAAGTLASRMGLPFTPAPGLTSGVSPALPSAQMTSSNQLTPVNPGDANGIVKNPLGTPLGGPANPLSALSGNGGILGAIGKKAETDHAQQQTQSGYVQMQNPADGSVQRVPVNAVPYFKAKGAIVVQGAA